MGKKSSEATGREQSLREALAAIVGDADNTGCEGNYVVDGALIERAQQLLKVRKEAAVMEPAPGMKLWLGVHSHRHGVGPMLLQAPTDMSVEDISNSLAQNDPHTYELHREDEWLQIEGSGTRTSSTWDPDEAGVTHKGRSVLPPFLLVAGSPGSSV